MQARVQKSTHYHRCMIVLLAMSVVFMTALTAWAQNNAHWSAVGVAGTVDERGWGVTDLVRGHVELKRSAPAGAHVKVRFNLQPVGSLLRDDIRSEDYGYAYRVRYRDSGELTEDGSQQRESITLQLYEYNLETGLRAVAPRFPFMSDALPPNPNERGFIERTVIICPAAFGKGDFRFDFENNAYFVEAILHKNASDGRPALGIVQIQAIECG